MGPNNWVKPTSNDLQIGRVEIRWVMLQLMATDRWLGVAVACAANFIAISSGCGPTVRPDKPPGEPGPVTRNERNVKPAPGGRQVMVGEMCPQGAGGRPAVAPLVMRAVSWVDHSNELTAVVERGGVPRFAVFGVDGKVAGMFETLGVAEVGLNLSVAAGTYVGAPPCTRDAGRGERSEEPTCGVALAGCGVAVGELGRADDPPSNTNYKTGAACLSGDAIAVDIDGDGVAESFPLASVLDGVRSPADEWTAARTAGAACKPSFQLYDIRLIPPPEGGRPVDPKHTVKLAVLGVIDLDGDGRRELVIQFEFPTARTIAVYTAPASPQRLELAGEGTSFPR